MKGPFEGISYKGWVKPMKKVLALTILAILCCFAFASCGGGELLTVKIMFTAEDELLGQSYVELEGETITVLDAINEHCAKTGLSVSLNDAQTSVTKVQTFKEKEDDYSIYFWEFTVNGAVPNGRANTVTLKDGDVVEYVYASTPKTINSTVEVKAQGSVIASQAIAYEEADPTIYNVIKFMLGLSELDYKFDEETGVFTKVSDYENKSEDGKDMMWTVSVNGEVAENITETLIKKDDVITLEYTVEIAEEEEVESEFEEVEE